MPNFDDVLRFHRKMGLPIGNFNDPQPLSPELMGQRIKFMQEELNELEEAALELQYVTNQLRRERLTAEIFDGLLDLNYVSCGTAVMMGMPWEEGWDLVQAANMAKMREADKDDEHHRGVVKPPGWKAPDIQGLIAKIVMEAQAE